MELWCLRPESGKVGACRALSLRSAARRILPLRLALLLFLADNLGVGLGGVFLIGQAYPNYRIIFALVPRRHFLAAFKLTHYRQERGADVSGGPASGGGDGGGGRLETSELGRTSSPQSRRIPARFISDLSA